MNWSGSSWWRASWFASEWVAGVNAPAPTPARTGGDPDKFRRQVLWLRSHLERRRRALLLALAVVLDEASEDP